MNTWILIMMISGQILVQEFNDNKSCENAGIMLSEQYNTKVYHCIFKGELNNGNSRNTIPSKKF